MRAYSILEVKNFMEVKATSNYDNDKNRNYCSSTYCIKDRFNATMDLVHIWSKNGIWTFRRFMSFFSEAKTNFKKICNFLHKVPLCVYISITSKTKIYYRRHTFQSLRINKKKQIIVKHFIIHDYCCISNRRVVFYSPKLWNHVKFHK